ncbi:MAG TPA: DsbA family oxidoreductase [Vicinamibacterales bacterium]|nr:DsbA family oxidoreductase [Vicinamibacterales bacterium]
MRVDIWSDIVCPWCYLGKRRFERALAAFEDRAEVEVVHRSFQLDPTRPKGQTQKRREMLMSKYHLTAAQVQTMDVRMEETAAADGLEYHLGDGVTGNTFDAHRLLHLAGARDRQDATLERFYRAYFTEGRSLFDDDSLRALAVESGLDAADVAGVLAGDTYADAVAADIREAQALGANGVPFFVFDNRFGVSGAQATDVFAQVLARARESRVTSNR